MNVNINFSLRFWQVLTATVLAVILFWGLILGISRGKVLAQAEATLVNTKGLAGALNYFYLDQERFPTASEFSDNNIMALYLNRVPVPEFASQSCQSSFVYKRLELDSYQLDFCLPARVAGFQTGWNRMQESK